MARNLVLVFLVAIIFSLLLSVTSQYYATEQAFTPDNLVKIDIGYQ